MSLLDEMKELGVNVDEGLKRFMGNSSLYERMFGSFVKMINKSLVDPDFDANDYQEVIEKTHAIKGATGNLSITPLYEGYSKIVSLLREDKPEEAREILKNILPVLKSILNHKETTGSLVLPDFFS